MYVMQSLPPEQQGLASGIMNTLVRLASTLSMGIATAVYSSVELTALGRAQPMLKFTRTFQVSVAMAGFGLLFIPFLRVGTQGAHPHHYDEAVSAPFEVAEKAPAAAVAGRSGKDGEAAGETLTREMREA